MPKKPGKSVLPKWVSALVPILVLAVLALINLIPVIALWLLRHVNRGDESWPHWGKERHRSASDADRER